MEGVHHTFRRPWVSDPVPVVHFLDTASAAVNVKYDIRGEHHLSLYERMQLSNLDPEKVESKRESCSIALLDCEGEEFIDFSRHFQVPEDNKLMTLKCHAEEMERRNQSYVYRNMVFQTCRYKHCSIGMEIVPRRRQSEAESDFVHVEHPEVLLTVQVYRPEMEQIFHQRQNPSRTPTFTVEQQFLVLGSQYLTEVRDLIRCQSDSTEVGEFSENPKSSNYKCEDVYKSGFFYINGTFYNDTRDPLNKDYSKPIIEWSQTAKDVGPFSVAKMEDTQFLDLTIQLGLPYLYMHQGHCEHMLVFSEMRLLNSKDPQNRLDYPLVQILQAKKPVRCMACMLYTAKWVTTHDERLAELPYFFCDECFNLFNYDENGAKVADFKAYKYCDKTSLF